MSDLVTRVAARFLEAKGTSRGWEHRKEKDDFAEQNIPPENLVFWRKVKNKLKGTPHERVEQFMEYLEEHPGENMEALQDSADKEMAKMTREWEKKRREEMKLEKDCDKNQTKYEEAWYKEQERATKEKNNLKQLKDKSEGVCKACPTCDESEGPKDYPGGNYDDMTPFAASLRVVAKYKAKKKVKTQDGEDMTVYEYSDKQIANRNREKAKRIEKLRHKIDDVRSKVKRDMKSSDPEKMLTALAVALMDHTFERVGNPESADDGHFGVTGWQRKHISFGKGGATIKYVGKSGVKHEKKVTDPAIKAALRDAYESSDDEDASIFEYEGGKVTAEKVNSYLKEYDVTAKDIRGMHANVEMQDRLREVRKKGGKLPEEKKDREKQLKEEFKEALEATAEAVGHEPATLKSQYLVPGLEDTFLKDGSVVDKLSSTVVSRYLIDIL